MRSALIVALSAMLLCGSPLAAHPTGCRPATVSDLSAIQTRLFDVLGREDRAGFDQLTTTDFVAIEGGASLTRDAFFGLLHDARRNGRAFVWRVTDAHVDADCTLAVLRYVNDGSVAIGGGSPEPVRWLETSVMRLTGGTWRVAMVTSQRATATRGPVPPPR